MRCRRIFGLMFAGAHAFRGCAKRFSAAVRILTSIDPKDGGQDPSELGLVESRLTLLIRSNTHGTPQTCAALCAKASTWLT